MKQVEFNAVPYWILTGLEGAKGRIITASGAAIIRVREADHPTDKELDETVEFLLKRAEKGDDEFPAFLESAKTGVPVRLGWDD